MHNNARGIDVGQLQQAANSLKSRILDNCRVQFANSKNNETEEIYNNMFDLFMNPLKVRGFFDNNTEEFIK